MTAGRKCARAPARLGALMYLADRSVAIPYNHTKSSDRMFNPEINTLSVDMTARASHTVANSM